MTKGLRWFTKFEQLGYRIERARRSGHWKVFDPAGRLVTTLSATPSDRRGHKNARADLCRHERHRHSTEPPEGEAMRKVRTSTRPETPAQVAQWEKTKRRYLQAGLCERDAAQAAWAHQSGAGGWNAAHPPCPTCAELMAVSFPYPTTNPLWRSVLRKRVQGKRR